MMTEKNSPATVDCDCAKRPTTVERTYVEVTTSTQHEECAEGCVATHDGIAAERTVREQIEYFDRGTLDEDGSIEWEIEKEEIQNHGVEVLDETIHCHSCMDIIDETCRVDDDCNPDCEVVDETYTYTCSNCGRVKDLGEYDLVVGA